MSTGLQEGRSKASRVQERQSVGWPGLWWFLGTVAVSHLESSLLQGDAFGREAGVSALRFCITQARSVITAENPSSAPKEQDKLFAAKAPETWNDEREKWDHPAPSPIESEAHCTQRTGPHCSVQEQGPMAWWKHAPGLPFVPSLSAPLRRGWSPLQVTAPSVWPEAAQAGGCCLSWQNQPHCSLSLSPAEPSPSPTWECSALAFLWMLEPQGRGWQGQVPPGSRARVMRGLGLQRGREFRSWVPAGRPALPLKGRPRRGRRG